MTDRENCPMRHENGNCLPLGGFCLAVNDEICETLHQAYHRGFQDGYIHRIDVELCGGDEGV